MLASRLSYTGLGWYLGVIVLDVVRGKRVLD
jgi:hypothetical protein